MSKEKIISGQSPGGERVRLAEILPLETPYVVQIFPIYACNLKCNYCIFQLKKTGRGFISDKVSMGIDLYKKCIEDMTKFPQKIKVLRFVGIGEPLLNKNITEMVEYAASKRIANTIEIITNASLLTPRMSDSLIKAGLTRLVVSMQGTSAEKYQEVCGTKVDFDELLKNLLYFYSNKTSTHVYVKIVNSAIEGEEDQQRFYDLFGNLCDSMAIEHTVPIHSGINYEKILSGNDAQFTQFGLPVSEVKICPQPFFTMQINPDGKVVPCYSFEYPKIVGNCNMQTPTDIWQSEQFQNFRRTMFEGIKNASDVCANCNIIKYRLFPEDDLSNDAERLKKYYYKVPQNE